MQPLTNTRPKGLLPVGNIPLIDHIIEAVSPYVDEYVFVVHHLEDMIRQHMQTRHPALSVTYRRQNEMNGTGDALMSAGRIDESFICINGDIFIERDCIDALLSAHMDSNRSVVTVKAMENDGSFGSVIVEGGTFKGIREKEQSPSALVNIGVYLFTPEIFDALSRISPSPRGEYELTDAISLIGERVAVSRYGGYWNDIGYPWSLLDANEHVVSKQERAIMGTIENGATCIGDVVVGEGSIVRSGAYIIGPVCIGDHCDIGPNCYVRPFTTIGDHCHVGNASEVKNSVLFSHTNVAHLSYVGDSIIGASCNLGAGTLVANLRHRKDAIKMEIKGKLVSSGRRKLGVVMGDETKTGINVSIYEGRKIGDHCGIGPGVIVEKNVEPYTFVVTKQETVMFRRE